MAFGEVTIDGTKYIERAQIFPATINVASNGQLLTGQRVALPGVANFLLKGLTRETTVNGVSSNIRFLFRLGNSDGMTWYYSGGLGAVTERVIDTNCFGTGQFPYALVPPISYSAAASIMFEVEDISNQAPYMISISFHGSYLIPVGGS